MSIIVIKVSNAICKVIDAIPEDCVSLHNKDDILFYDTISKNGEAVGFQVHWPSEFIQENFSSQITDLTAQVFPRFFFENGMSGSPDGHELFGDLSVYKCPSSDLVLVFHKLSPGHPLFDLLSAKAEKVRGQEP